MLMLHNRVVFGAFLCVVAYLSAGCTVLRIDANAPIPMLLNRPGDDSVEFIGGITGQKRYVFDYTGHYDPYDVLREQSPETRADAIANVRLEVKTTVTDFFINLFTMGLAASRTVEVQGALVRWQRGVSGRGYGRRPSRPQDAPLVCGERSVVCRR